MKVIIAEDNDLKSSAISEFLLKNFPDSEITITTAIRSTFNAIKNDNFDLLLLDMTMPSFEGDNDIDRGELRALAGRDIISKMSYRRLFIPTIVITQFEIFGRQSNMTPIGEIANELSVKFPEIIRGCILFNFQSDIWQKDLLTIIKDIIND